MVNHGTITGTLSLFKIFEGLSWNYRTSTLHRSETSGIDERAVRRVKKVLQQYFYSLDWMKNGWMILWEAVAVCETSKTSWHKGKLRTFLEQWLDVLWFQCETNKTSSFWQECVIWNLGYELIADGIWKGDVPIADREELGKLDASEIYLERTTRKKY